MTRSYSDWAAYGMYPDEPNTTYDPPTNTTMERAAFTTMAKHIVGMLDNTGNNYFMFRCDLPGELHLNYVHPAAASGATVFVELYDYQQNMLLSRPMSASELFSFQLNTTGLFYINVRATDGAMGLSSYAILPALTNAGTNELMRGSVSDDVFTSGAGNDMIIGAGGFDTVRYPGARANSLVTFSDAGLGIHTAGLGKDTLVGISRLEFSDFTVDIGVDSDAAQVYRVYDAVFNRPPDGAGLGFWIHNMDQGTSLLSVASHFMLSNEFRATYGDNPTVRDLVTGYYRNILDREPEQAGIDFWMDVLDDGRASSAEVLVAISESAEHQALLIGQVSHGVSYIPWGGQ